MRLLKGARQIRFAIVGRGASGGHLSLFRSQQLAAPGKGHKLEVVQSCSDRILSPHPHSTSRLRVTQES